MSKVECYAVFEGGGMKGAAFSGALKAANESGLEFIGYAGASVGAIIAFMAAIGMSGEEIHSELLKLDFIECLKEPTPGELEDIKALIDKVGKVGLLNNDINLVGKSIRFLFFLAKFAIRKRNRRLFGFVRRLFKNKGLYEREGLISVLIDIAFKKRPELFYFEGDESSSPQEAYLKISFEHFFNVTAKDLRVVATDLVSGRAIEFSYLENPQANVFNIIAASAAYPIIFEPFKYNGYLLVDGGLSCNLPTYLFNNPNHKKLPVYAFDLIQDSDEGVFGVESGNYSAVEYLNRLANSALDASNNIISSVVGGLSVPILVPKNINTLDFKLDSQSLNALYDIGNKSATDFFSNNKITSLLSKSRTEHDIAKLLYGRHDTLLNILISFIPNINDRPVRSWLYTSINSKDFNIVTFAKHYNGNIKDISDYQYSLSQQDIDCVTSWNTKTTIIACNDYSTRICIPISRGDIDSTATIAVLCISMSVNFTQCEWIEDSSDGVDISSETATILSEFVQIIRNAILGHQARFYENI